MATKVKKEITIKLKGYKISGEVAIKLWGGGNAMIDMNPTLIHQTKYPTKKQIINAVNDGGFGCEIILEAAVRIHALYGDNYYVYLETQYLDKKDLTNNNNRGV